MVREVGSEVQRRNRFVSSSKRDCPEKHFLMGLGRLEMGKKDTSGLYEV